MAMVGVVGLELGCYVQFTYRYTTTWLILYDKHFIIVCLFVCLFKYLIGNLFKADLH